MFNVQCFSNIVHSQCLIMTDANVGLLVSVSLYLFFKRHTLRFWNAAFFDAVHCERNKRSPTTR